MHKQKLGVAVAALTGALLLGACGREVPASANVRQGPATSDAITVVATDNEFSPKQIKATAGEEITIEVTNEGEAAHNLVIGDLDVSTGTLEKGDVASATFTMPDSATEFLCTFHGGMKGELVPETA